MAEGGVDAGTAVLSVVGDWTGLGKDYDSKGAQSVTDTAKRAAAAFAGVFATIKITDFIHGAVTEMNEAQRVGTQTATILANIGPAAGISAKEVDDLAQAMLRQSGVDDEVAKSAINTALRLGLTGDAVRRVTQDANDLSQSFGDMGSDAELLSKALANPEQAARLLKPAIGQLTDAQLASIKAFEAHGNEAAAQGVILDAVEAKVHGAAAAFGDTLPGATKRATEEWKNAKAELVGGLAPAMELGAKGTELLASGIHALPPGAQEATGAVLLLGSGVVAASTAVSNAVNIWDKLRAAHLTNAAASEVDAVATAEASAAQATLATNSAAAVSTLYAEDAALIGGGAAFGAWGAAAAAAIVTVSTLLDIMGSKQDHNIDVQKRLGESTRDLAVDYTTLLFEGNTEDAPKLLKGLAESGAAGIGTLQRLRDGLKDMGYDTTLVDKAIADATASQHNYNSAVAAGTAMVDGFDAALQKADQTRASEVDLVRGAFDAEQRYESATRSVQDALRGREQATQRVADAQKALNKALQPASDEDVGKADLDIASAKLRVGDAAKTVRDAEAELTKDRKDGKHTADDVADAQRKIEEANIAYQQAVYGVTDAEGRMQELQKKGTEQDDAVISARQNLASAQDGLRTSADRVTQSLKDQADAQIAVKDADYKLLHDGVEPVNVALQNMLDIYGALEGKLDPSNPLAKNLDTIISQFGALAALFASEPGPGGTIGPGRDVTPPGYIPKYPDKATGGWVDPNQVIHGAEKGFELAVLPSDGYYRAPGSGMHVVTHEDSSRLLSSLSGSAAGGGRHIHLHGDIVVQNPAAEMASTSIGHELQILSDQLAMAAP